MLKIERLGKNHERKGFDCGDKRLNEFLQKSALQHADRNISRTFVLIDDESPKEIFGYYTLIVCEVVPSNIPDPRLQRYPHPMPAAKLARLAIHVHHQRNGLGANLLINAMERTVRISENAGLIGMFIDAKDDNAASYYMQFGFIPIENNRLLLYLPLATIRRAVEDKS
jgi:GNAT superfamily N-acetyltransferase